MTSQAPYSTLQLSSRGIAKVHTARRPKPAELATVTNIADKLAERAERDAKRSENEKMKRRAKATWDFSTATKNRFEDAVYELDMSHWSLDNPPFFAVATVKGSAFMAAGLKRNPDSRREYFEKYAPVMHELNKRFKEKLASRFRSAFGIELDAVVVAEFQETGNPHHNIFMTRPLNADASEMLSNHPSGKGGRLKKFNGLSFAEWFEYTVGDLNGQRAEFNAETQEGRLTRVPRREDVPFAPSMQDYAGRFINYMRKDCPDLAEKATYQHKTPAPYMGQMFEWWFIIGFTNKRRSGGEREMITCLTRAADVAMRAWFGARSRRERTVKEMKDGKFIDVSMWSTELHDHCVTGGTFERPLTAEEIRELRRLILVKNQVPDGVVTADPIDSVSTAYAISEPLNASESVSVEVLEELEPEEDIRPITELLEACGFSAKEQRAVTRTARRRAWKQEQLALRAAAENDYSY